MSSRSSIGVRLNGFFSIWYVPCKPCTYLASRLAVSPNRSNQASTWASSPRIIIGCFHNGLWAYGALCTNHAPILHQNCLQTDWSKIPYDTHDLGVLSGASKLISENMVCSMQIIHLSCIKICTISKDRTELSLEPLHLGVPSGTSTTVSESMVHWTQTMHLSCTETYTISN